MPVVEKMYQHSIKRPDIDIFKWQSLSRVCFFVLFLMTSFITVASQNGQVQAFNDTPEKDKAVYHYRTSQGGNWDAVNRWQILDPNTGNWRTPTTTEGYPGQNPGTGTVTIQNNHNITLNVSPQHAIENLEFNSGGTSTTLSFQAENSLIILNDLVINTNTSNNRNRSVDIGNGTLTVSDVYVYSDGGTDSRDSFILINNGTLNVSGNVTMNSTGARTYIRFTGNGTLNVGGTITGGNITSNNGGHNTNGPASGTVNYNHAGDQQVGNYNYYNLAISGGGRKSLQGNTTVSNQLLLNGGLLTLGIHNLTLANNASNAITGSFGASNMIETNAEGVLIRNAAAAKPILFPIGSEGFYAPASIISTNTNTGNIRIRTEKFTELGPQYLSRYWEVVTSANIRPVSVSFTYGAGEIPQAPTQVLVRPQGQDWQNPSSGSFSFATHSFTVNGSNQITTTASRWTAGPEPGTFFSHKSGSWNDPTTWTFDPSGTTQTSTGIPGKDAAVVVLPGRTVNLTADVVSQGLDITIREGATLDLMTARFTQTLVRLNGQGTLRLASTHYPSVGENLFVTAAGGTTEYYNSSSFELPLSQTTYNNLRINLQSGVVATQKHNLTLNGNLHVQNGTFRINDGTNARRSLEVLGNVQVETNGLIAVGTGQTNTTTTNPSNGGTTGTPPFIAYYDNHSHRVVIHGDFINHGTVRFTNQTHPVYNAFPTNGFATVYFRGHTNNVLHCQGQTDFYNLVLDKGEDQTYQLVVHSSHYHHFRLFGANTASGYGGGANPNLRKALWIRNGSLVLRGSTIIPSLTESNESSGTPNGDFYIPANGALILDGSEVIVLTTADDYREVNLAYGVSAPNNAAMGILPSGGIQSFSIYGLLRVNNGYLSTRESGGLIQWSVAAGQVEIHGGTVDTKQFRTAGTSGGLTSFTQTGGVFELRGRFQRTPQNYTTISNLVNAPVNTNRETGGLQPAVGTFNINEAENVFNMSGGTMRIFDVCGTNSDQQLAVEINSSSNNINVSGGTIEIRPMTGTGTDAGEYRIHTTAPFGNFTVNRHSGTAQVVLRNHPLRLLGNLRIESGVFNANNLDVTLGGNFLAAAGTSYTPGNNWTIFNGQGNQTATLNTANAFAFRKLRMEKPANRSLTFAGSQSQVQITDSLIIHTGRFNDGSKTITLISSASNITTGVYNSGTHLGNGKIVLAGNAQMVIDGDGSGIFRNLELNNSHISAAPVRLTAATTITGTLTFANDKLLNLQSHNLRFTSTATVSGHGPNRYAITSGEAGNGGITREYSEGSKSFTFPLGGNSTRRSDPAYTPTTLTINGSAETYGSITVVPVGYEHPATTIKGRSLTYFWRVKSQGFQLGSATLSHRYHYQQGDVVTGADITEDQYVAARFLMETTSWSNGQASDVDHTNNIIGTTANFLHQVDYIDGDYTAGDNTSDPFGQPEVFYSRSSGLWGTVTNWSTTGHTGGQATRVPGAGDIVVIGNNDSIWLATEPALPHYNTNPNNSFYQLNKAPVSAAILKIEAGSVLDLQNNPASSFGMVVNHVNGNGKLRLTTRHATNFDSPHSFTFPHGDYSDFNSNFGFVEFYTINPQSGTIFILPTNADTYGNVILSPWGGSNIIFPNISMVDILGDLITRGQTWESWLAMSWHVNYGPVVPKMVSVKGNLHIQGGSFVFIGNGATPQTIIVDGDVIVNPGAGIDVYADGSNPSFANFMHIGGSLINNSDNSLPAAWGGHAGSNARFFVDNNRRIELTFFGKGTSSLTHDPALSANPSTRLDRVTINKGTSQADSLIIDIGGSLVTHTNDWLTLQNGTLVYRRNNTSQHFTLTTNSPFTIPETAGLLIDYTGTQNVLIGNAANDNNDLFLDGKLTIRSGNVFVGPTNAPNNNNDIVYSGGGNSTLDIRGGNLTVNGQIRRSTSTTTGVLKYYQSGGEVTINGRNANLTRAKLEVVNNGSVFNMSGGILTIVRGGGVNFGDLYIRPENGSVTGGLIRFVHGFNAAQVYRLDASIALHDLTIQGSASHEARVLLMINPLQLRGSLNLINPRSVLDVHPQNNIPVWIQGDFVNNGTYLHHSNTTRFHGNTQEIQGSSNTTFHNLVVDASNSLIINRNLQVNGNLEIVRGSFALSQYWLELRGNLVNNGSYTDEGNGILLKGTNPQFISGTGNFGSLVLENSQGARLMNSITLSRNLELRNGVFNLGSHQLGLSYSSNILGAPFSSQKMIATDGVISSGGVLKFFPQYNGSEQVFVFPLGTGNKYTPVEFRWTQNNQAGSLRINNVNAHHPGVLDPNRVLRYYWEVERYALAGIHGSLRYFYREEDVRGDEQAYHAVRTLGMDTWSKFGPELVDEVNNVITFNFSNFSDLTGEYTAGEEDAFPDNIPRFRSVKNGNWSDHTTWQQVSGDPYVLAGGPNGFIVDVLENHTVTLDQNYASAYRTDIAGTLRYVSGFFGHNMGLVTGSGTLYMEGGLMPAGRYTSFLDCSNGGTLEYGGSGSYQIIADLFSKIPRIYFTGTGNRILPSKDLAVCHRMLINGPDVDNSLHNRSLSILGELHRQQGVFKAGTGASARVIMEGSQKQSLGGALGQFTGNSAFHHFEIRNAAGLDILPGGQVEIMGTLYLTQGNIFTQSALDLTLTNVFDNCVSPSGGSIQSYVEGPLSRTMQTGGDFRFPIGKQGVLGNKVRVIQPQNSGVWTAEYFQPNDSYSSYNFPLVYVNSQEFWELKANGSASIAVGWDHASDLTPLMTEGGINDLRLAEYVSEVWSERDSKGQGGDQSGWVISADRIHVPVSGRFTTASVSSVKPRARMMPGAAICGNQGIPVEFIGSGMNLNYKLVYSRNGIKQEAIINSLPFAIPTDNSNATYQLEEFVFNYPLAPVTGVVDKSIVQSWQNPTQALAGSDQSHCGAHSAVMAANQPTVGVGLWSVVQGNGGSFSNTNYHNTTFNGINGNTYTLQWTISNGGCISQDLVDISFPLLPEPPTAFSIFQEEVCQGMEQVAYGVGHIPAVGYHWSYTGSGASFGGSGSQVEVHFADGATSGQIQVYTSNGCGNSPVLSKPVAVFSKPEISLSTQLATPANMACPGQSITFSPQGIPGGFTVFSTDFLVNGTLAASGSANSFTTSTLNDGDIVSAIYTTNGGCITPAVNTLEMAIGQGYWTGRNSNLWSESTNWACGVVPVATTDAVIHPAAHNKQASISPGQVFDARNIVVHPGNTLRIDNATLNVYGNFSLDGSLIGTGNTLNFTGSANQVIEGTGDISMQNLSLNKTDGVLTLQSPVHVNGTLGMHQGVLQSQTSTMLTLGNNATVQGDNTASFVSGPMRKVGNTDFVFPTGKSGRRGRIGVSGISASKSEIIFQAEYFTGHANHVDVYNLDEGLLLISQQEYWELSNPTSNENLSAHVTLHWDDAGFSGISNPEAVRVVQFRDGQWKNHGPAPDDNPHDDFVTTSTPFNTWGQITFGSKSGDNPFPIELLYFTASAASQSVDLRWATASEINNDFFTLERSSCGRVFEPIGFVSSKAPNGYSTQTLLYQWHDDQPLSGVSYYRLKQTDFDGTFDYSPIVAVRITEQRQNALRLYPNPSRGDAFNVLLQTEHSYQRVGIVVTDTYGKQVWSGQEYTDENGVLLTKVQPGAVLQPGVYVVSLSAEGFRLSQRMVVR